jgi:hypothetical protein
VIQPTVSVRGQDVRYRAVQRRVHAGLFGQFDDAAGKPANLEPVAALEEVMADETPAANSRCCSA